MNNRMTIVLNGLGMLLGAAGLALSAGAVAAQSGEDAPPPPEITSGDQGAAADQGAGTSREAPPPTEVRTRQQFGKTITEYERQGRVFMMTVKPRVGPTQYWNDPDGDGQFQLSTSSGLDEETNLPKWRLGGW